MAKLNKMNWTVVTQPLNKRLFRQPIGCTIFDAKKGSSDQICMCLLEAISGEFEATKIMALLKLT